MFAAAPSRSRSRWRERLEIFGRWTCVLGSALLAPATIVASLPSPVRYWLGVPVGALVLAAIAIARPHALREAALVASTTLAGAVSSPASGRALFAFVGGARATTSPAAAAAATRFVTTTQVGFLVVFAISAFLLTVRLRLTDDDAEPMHEKRVDADTAPARAAESGVPGLEGLAAMPENRGR